MTTNPVLELDAALQSCLHTLFDLAVSHKAHVDGFPDIAGDLDPVSWGRACVEELRALSAAHATAERFRNSSRSKLVEAANPVDSPKTGCAHDIPCDAAGQLLFVITKLADRKFRSFDDIPADRLTALFAGGLDLSQHFARYFGFARYDVSRVRAAIEREAAKAGLVEAGVDGRNTTKPQEFVTLRTVAKAMAKHNLTPSKPDNLKAKLTKEPYCLKVYSLDTQGNPLAVDKTALLASGFLDTDEMRPVRDLVVNDAGPTRER